MCAINGIFAYHYAANPVNPAEVVATRDHMQARGPDGCGLWVAPSERVGFGHRRLAIIDLSDAGAQPMRSADGRFVITFNGEIYNYQALRHDLEKQGYVFQSQSDTEVLLHLFAQRGPDMVYELRGMFAVAIWDELKQELFLARDPYGIKPLYYADDGWTFRFASQVKALLVGWGVSKEPEPAGLVGFYLWGSVPEPFTTYQAIRALPAGCTMSVDRLGGGGPKRYHSIASAYGARPIKFSQARERAEYAREALLDSVRHHLTADVPVGAFLSAGVDSGALIGLMRDAGVDELQTLTVGFEEFAGQHDDETPLAAEVARFYGTRHTTRMVLRDEFERDLPSILAAMDQPSIDGVNTWFVSKAARELGLKVAISGLGGDELLGGYPAFRDVPRWARLTALPSRLPLLGRLMRKCLTQFGGAFNLNPKAAGLLEIGGSYPGAYLLKRGLFMPWELSDVLPKDIMETGLRRLDPLRLAGSVLQPGPRSAFGRVAALESSLYMRNQLLRDTDWASMAHGLEVRVPLVDHVLLDRLARLHGAFGGSGKDLLAAAPSQPLPETIVRRPKTGFTTPVAAWIKGAAPSPAVQGATKPQPWAREWSRAVTGRFTAAA